MATQRFITLDECNMKHSSMRWVFSILVLVGGGLGGLAIQASFASSRAATAAAVAQNDATDAKEAAREARDAVRDVKADLNFVNANMRQLIDSNRAISAGIGRLEKGKK